MEKDFEKDLENPLFHWNMSHTIDFQVYNCGFDIKHILKMLEIL